MNRTRQISSLLIFACCLTFSILFVIITYDNTISSIEELTEIEGTIIRLSPLKTKGSISYDLFIDGYSNEFKIAADYNDIFQFKKLINDNDQSKNFHFAIRRTDFEKINGDETIKIFGVRSKLIKYLNPEDVVINDNRSRKYTAPVGGTVLVIISIAVFIYRRYYHEHDF